MKNTDNVCINTDVLESISTDKVKPKKIDEMKCAPGKKFEAGSCITLPILIEMVNAYNKVHDNKIKLSCKSEILHPNRYKKYLLKNINDRFKNVCTDQLCWTKQDFIKKMDDVLREQLEKYIVRPLGPHGQFEWLNTNNIDEVMDQYENMYKDFVYLGAVPMDFQNLNLDGLSNINLDKHKNDGKSKFGIIFNLDPHYKGGSHWVSLFINVKEKTIFFFDSAGEYVPQQIKKFADNVIEQGKKLSSPINFKFDQNHPVEHQYGNTECGIYSIFFITHMLEDKITGHYMKTHILKDKYMENFRKIYYNQNGDL